MYLKTLFVNGKIFTGNPEMPFAEAMSVSLGGFDYVGSLKGLLESVNVTSLYDPEILNFEVVDLKKRFVIPGFCDADIRRLAPEEIVAAGKEMAEKGIVAFAAEGTSKNQDLFDEYTKAGDEGLAQSVALYYPSEYALSKEGFLEDKHAMIRSRKVHVAGLELDSSRIFIEEEKGPILDFCKANYCQLSVGMENDARAEELLEEFKQEKNWMEEVGLSNLRLHRGKGDFNPFADIKEALLEELNRDNDSRYVDEGGNKYIDLGLAVMGYTKYAAELAGFMGIGEIKVGNRASFLILNKDLTSIPLNELDQVKPEVTLIDGHIVFPEIQVKQSSGIHLDVQSQ